VGYGLVWVKQLWLCVGFGLKTGLGEKRFMGMDLLFGYGEGYGLVKQIRSTLFNDGTDSPGIWIGFGMEMVGYGFGLKETEMVSFR